MSDPVHVTAIISPAPGKEARVQSLIEDVVKGTEAGEQNTTTYFLTKDVNSSDFIVIETYKSHADVEFHMQQAYFQNLVKALQEEGLVSKPPAIIESKKIAGFYTR